MNSIKYILVVSVISLLASCANTKLSRSWVEPDNEKTYSNLLIIGIGESQQTRRAYESVFVEELRDSGSQAEASYKLIKSSETIERDTVQKATKGMGIDGVIITHMVAIDEETSYRSGAGYSRTGYGRYGRGMYGYYPRVNSYVNSPGYYTTHKTFSLETSLYDIVSEEMVWTARSNSFSPESIDEVIVDMTKLLIKDLKDKNLIIN